MFNFGTSKTSSQSSSLGYGYQGSESLSDSLARARSRETVAFEDQFRDLYGNASGAAAKVAALAPTLQQQAGQLFSGGLSFLDTLQGEGVVDEQISSLGADLGRFFQEQINPAITTRGVATGTLGGGRQGVAQAGAARAVADEYAQGVTNLRAADRTARNQAASTWLAAIPGLFGVAQGAMGAELLPYQALGEILGGPTTLTSSDSASIAQAISRAFGEDFQTSQSTSKGKSLNFGFGGFGGGTS
jgi:hypothetical protein